MQPWIWAVIAAAVVIVVVAAVTFWLNERRRRRTERLHSHFGDEYDHAVERNGRKAAEDELQSREERVSQLDIRRLTPGETHQFADRWQVTQADFVDEPGGAIKEADRLVMEVMQARGYPMGDFEQRAADVSVDHPEVVRNYRAAHAVAIRHSRAAASTEDLRQAMVHYRALFTDLLETDEGAVPPPEMRAN